MKVSLKEVMKYSMCDKSRDELIAIFNSMKTSSKEDRFHYIKCWNGEQEEEPIVLTKGLMTETPTTHDTANGEVSLAACNELKEAIEDRPDVSDSLSGSQ